MTAGRLVLVLGRDRVGVVARSEGFTYYLTECCGASATGTAYGTACRACYEEIDPALGGLPCNELVTGADGGLEVRETPLRLVEVYGDGLPYDTWKARAIGPGSVTA